MNMIFDFYIPEEYRGRKVNIPKLYCKAEENITLNIPKDANYLFIPPYNPEDKEIDGQLYLPFFGIVYFNSEGEKIYNEFINCYNEVISLESRLELIFERVKS